MSEATTNIDENIVKNFGHNINSGIKEKVFEWFQIHETYESTIEFKQVIEKNQKIREERINLLLPNMEKEFKNFSEKLNKRQKFRKINDNVLFKIIKPIIPYVFTVLFFVLFYFGIYKFGFMFNIVKNIFGIIPILGGILGFAMGVGAEILLFVYIIILPFRFTDSLLYALITKEALFAQKSDLEYYNSDEYILKDSPHIEAFMLGNCIYKKSNLGISHLPGNNNYRYKSIKAKNVFIPGEIFNMNFEEFVDFIKIIFEPQNNSFDSETVFESIFFYPNKEEINKNKEIRTKVKHDLENEIKDKRNLIRAKNCINLVERKINQSSNYSNTRPTQTIRQNQYSTYTKGMSNGSDRKKMELITQINMINSKDIRSCALILTGQESYRSCNQIFGISGGSDNWLWFTKSIMESNELYLNKISNNDLRNCAKAIITSNHSILSMINNDDIRIFTQIVIEKQELFTGYVNNKDLMILARVLIEHRIF